MVLACLAYLSVLRVSSTWALDGLIVANIAVCELPPRLSFNSLKLGRFFTMHSQRTYQRFSKNKNCSNKSTHQTIFKVYRTIKLNQHKVILSILIFITSSKA
jgi:hypothetical protein